VRDDWHPAREVVAGIITHAPFLSQPPLAPIV
jgi:hypothetical protein